LANGNASEHLFGIVRFSRFDLGDERTVACGSLRRSEKQHELVAIERMAFTTSPARLEKDELRTRRVPAAINTKPRRINTRRIEVAIVKRYLA
jgi:hypothetical protein